MRVGILAALLCGTLLVLLEPATGRAEDPPLLDPLAGVIRGTGLPPRVGCWSQPSNVPWYHGYYVGGGCPTCRGRPRNLDEGTWGWDYVGRCLPRNVVLQWWPGGRRQGGTGSYRFDGPHMIHLATHPHKEQCEP